MEKRQRVAVVTGGAAGLGLALSRRLSVGGARVHVLDVSDGASKGEPLIFHRVDVSKRHELADFVAYLGQHERRVDLWINNAAINIVGECADLEPADFTRVISVNLQGAIDGALMAFELMRGQGGGQIVNIASAAGLLAYPTTAPYSSAKAGLIAFSLALRAEARAHGVKVNVACPGVIATSIFDSQDVRGMDNARYASLLPRSRMTAEAAAQAVLDGALRDRAVHVFPLSVRLATAAARWVPPLRDMIAAAALGRFRRAKG